MVADINPGTGSLSQIRQGIFLIAPIVVGPENRLYFAADDGEHGFELWSTDGRPANTAMVADLSPGLASADPYGMTRAGAKLFFGADDGLHGRELWALPIGPELNHP
jgi:ELWxxDGT repeat protein